MQKSHLFLYPLLGLSFREPFKPENTFIEFRDEVKKEDGKLVCIYQPQYSEEYYNYRNNVLLQHPLYEKMITTRDKNIIIFNLSTDFKDTYERFLEGQYSKFSPLAKELISDYYKESEIAAISIQSHLEPEEFHQMYADFLNVSVDLIAKRYETLSPPCMEREVYA
jgi:ubiquinone/menaquinone biosynthesis C-methylase UbiE